MSWKRELRAPLQQIFGGRVFAPILAACDEAHQRVLRSRVFVALHMHAGDGNVHTNIPVNSDDYEMLQAATAAVDAHHGDRARPRRRDLRRAWHRHHQARVPRRGRDAEFRAYKQRIDPEGRFNRGKLLPGGDLSNAYTPSFNLLGHESLIMQQSDIGSISDAIKDCLRCGKCKPVCATHVPRANLLYSPRDKILATSLLIEAFLYEEQTRRGVSIRHWDEFADVGDHCTVCHKCAAPVRWTSTSAMCRWRCAICCGAWARSASTRARPRRMFFLNATNPKTIRSDAQADDRVGLQGAARWRITARCRAWRGRRRAIRRPPPASRRCASR